MTVLRQKFGMMGLLKAKDTGIKQNFRAEIRRIKLDPQQLLRGKAVLQGLSLAMAGAIIALYRGQRGCHSAIVVGVGQALGNLFRDIKSQGFAVKLSKGGHQKFAAIGHIDEGHFTGL